MFLLSLFLAFNTVISPASPVAAGPQIHIETNNMEENTIEAHVMVKGAEAGVLGAAFHLNYDSNILEYQSYENGDFLEQASTPIYLVHNKESKIYFGSTLKRGEGLAKGNGRLVTFYFKPIKEGKSEFSFSNTNLAGFEGKRVEVKADWKPYELQSNILAEENNFIALIWAFIPMALLLIFIKLRSKQKR